MKHGPSVTASPAGAGTELEDFDLSASPNDHGSVRLLRRLLEGAGVPGTEIDERLLTGSVEALRHFEVEEDGGDDGRIGKEREDPHLGAAGGTEERQHVVDASEQDGPADPRGRDRSGGGLGGWAG